MLTLVHAIVAGASHINHADVLRSGNTAGVLGHRVMAPSTLGTFLRAFSFGHVRQLDAVMAGRFTGHGAWRGPRDGRLVIDVDSTIVEVAGRKSAAPPTATPRCWACTRYLRTRADTGEVLHARMRKGSANTQRGARRFIEELVARVRRAGATGEIVVRFDSGFWSKRDDRVLERLKVSLHDGRAGTPWPKVIAAIDEEAWRSIDYTEEGEAQVAESLQGQAAGRAPHTAHRRAPAPLWPNWRHFAFLTDLAGDVVDIDAFHRHHAVVELAIRDLKEGAGLRARPSGDFSANSAWLACAAVAHNLIRWTATLGEPTPSRTLTSHVPSATSSSTCLAGSSTMPAAHAARSAALAVAASVPAAARRPAASRTQDRLRRAGGWRTADDRASGADNRDEQHKSLSSHAPRAHVAVSGGPRHHGWPDRWANPSRSRYLSVDQGLGH